MTPLRYATLAATVMIGLPASASATQSGIAPAPVTVAPAAPQPGLSLEDLVRLHVAVTSLMTHPTPDALTTIQEIRGLMITRLSPAPVSAVPPAETEREGRPGEPGESGRQAAALTRPLKACSRLGWHGTRD
jgi:hypothetical protein